MARWVADAGIADIGQTGAIGVDATTTSRPVDADRIGRRAAILPGSTTGIAIGGRTDIPGGAAGSVAYADAVAAAVDFTATLGRSATNPSAHLRLRTANFFAGTNGAGRTAGVVTTLGRGSAAIRSTFDPGRATTLAIAPDLNAWAFRDRGGIGGGPPGGIGVVGSGQGREPGDAQSKERFDHRAAAGPIGKRARESVEPPIVHRKTSPGKASG